MGLFKSEKEEPRASDSSQAPPPFVEDQIDSGDGLSSDNADQLQRHLGNRQIQLIAIGGSIGTALFVSIGTGLYHGGAANLLIAYTIQSCVLAMVNNSVAEMTTAFPVSGGFIRHAGHWVDDALGFMVGGLLRLKSVETTLKPICTSVFRFANTTFQRLAGTSSSTKLCSYRSKFQPSHWSCHIGMHRSRTQVPLLV